MTRDEIKRILLRYNAVSMEQLDLTNLSHFIEQVPKDIYDLGKELEKLTKERDVAVEDLRDRHCRDSVACDSCEYDGKSPFNCSECDSDNASLWQWRGVMEAANV